MYRAGQVPDHVQRSYTDQNRWMYVAPVRKAITGEDIVLFLIKVLAAGVFFFAVGMFVALCVRTW